MTDVRQPVRKPSSDHFLMNISKLNFSVIEDTLQYFGCIMHVSFY